MGIPYRRHPSCEREPLIAGYPTTPGGRTEWPRPQQDRSRSGRSGRYLLDEMDMAPAGALVRARRHARLPARGRGHRSRHHTLVLFRHRATALAAALDGQVAVADQLTSTIAPPAPSTSTSRPTTSSTALKAVPTTRPTVPPVAPPTTTRAPAPTAGSQNVSPSSWTVESNGISLTLRMEPATPHVGDTITFTLESSATVATDYCCVVYLYVNGEIVYNRFHGPGPCPLVQGPAVDKATYLATRAGTLGLTMQASRVKLCIAPPEFTTVNLPASTLVQPGG